MAENDNDEARNQEFLNLADQFIDLANKHLTGHDPSMISAAFMFASSRFCAFSVAAQIDDEKQFEAEKNDALQHYSDEYRDMLKQNLDQHGGLLDTIDPNA